MNENPTLKEIAVAKAEAEEKIAAAVKEFQLITQIFHVDRIDIKGDGGVHLRVSVNI